MEIKISAAELCLRENQPLSLHAARGLRIACSAGTLWITVAGDGEDIFLLAGQGYEVRGNGLVVIESIGEARLRLASQPARDFFHHLARRLRAEIRCAVLFQTISALTAGNHNGGPAAAR